MEHKLQRKEDEHGLGHAEAKRYSSQNCSRNSLEKCAKTQRKNQDNMD